MEVSEMREMRIEAYLRSLDASLSPFLQELEQEAKDGLVPIIGFETRSLLKLLLAMKDPKAILEVGTAVGFSALFMAEHSEKAKITTIENYPKRLFLAKGNFCKAGKEDRILLLEGDALEVLKGLNDPFDFIFMDAAKGQYLTFLPEILRLLKPGATLVSDNVLQGGEILESRFVVTRRNRTIHKRMREYLYALTHDPRLTTMILPIGDGITVSERNEA